MLIYFTLLASSSDYGIEILNSENRTFPADNVQKRNCKVWLQENHSNHCILKVIGSASKNLTL